MLNWLTKLFRRPPDVPPPRRRALASKVRVTCDDKTITIGDEEGCVTKLAWTELANVAVVTTELGPFEDDLYWVLTDRAGRQLPPIPMGARGEDALLAAMQGRLAGFDNMAVVEAMGSVSAGMFQIWPAAPLA
jgi:hypothetical protein